MRALLIGSPPPGLSEDTYVEGPPYESVVIGSMTFGELLHPADERIFGALAQGMPVILYTPGLPQSRGNRALGASLSSACRQLKNWGVVFTDGSHKKLITAEGARALKKQGRRPPPGAVLTPLAKEILEGNL